MRLRVTPMMTAAALAVGFLLLCALPIVRAQTAQYSAGCSRAPRAMPTGLVIGMARYTLPHGRDPVRETAELTAGAPCAAGIAECARVSPSVLARVYAAIRVRVRRDAPNGSPHYGARTVYARWGARRCEVADTRDAPVVAADRAVFSAAFDAVLTAIASARR